MTTSPLAPLLSAFSAVPEVSRLLSRAADLAEVDVVAPAGVRPLLVSSIPTEGTVLLVASTAREADDLSLIHI